MDYQKELADLIARYAPVDDLRILLATGGSVNEPVTKGLRPLHYAAFQNNLDAANFLLLRGAEIDARDDMGYTALHVCSEQGHLRLVKLLLDHKATVCFSNRRFTPDFEEESPSCGMRVCEPLRLAIKNHHYEIAELLLENGADPNARYFTGHEINLVDPLDVQYLDLLLKFGANPDCRDRQSLTTLMNACRRAECLESAFLLVSFGADVNATTDEERDFRTPMHFAVISGNLSLVQMLISNGAMVQFKNYTKPTPLYFAVLKGNVQILEHLICAGADVNAGSSIVGSPLHVALSEAIPNKLDVVRALLQGNADPNYYIEGDRGPLIRPPLGDYFYFCEQPDPRVVRLLLQYGARIIMKGQRQHPLGIIRTFHRLHLGINTEVVDLLLSAAEEFCMTFIENSSKLNSTQKRLLLDKASNPRSLKEISRISLRLQFGTGPQLFNAIHKLQVPDTLKTFLLFEDDT